MSFVVVRVLNGVLSGFLFNVFWIGLRVTCSYVDA